MPGSSSERIHSLLISPYPSTDIQDLTDVQKSYPSAYIRINNPVFNPNRSNLPKIRHIRPNNRLPKGDRRSFISCCHCLRSSRRRR
jgi:hypothetical protein